MKTIINNINKVIAFARLYSFIIGITLIIQACSEPKYDIPDAESYSKIFMQAASNGTLSKSFPIEDTWHSIPLGAGYGGLVKPDQKITVQLSVDPSKLEEYNTANNTNYTLPPSGSYTFDGGTVEILPGLSGSNSVQLKVNPLKLGGTRTYLIPISITNVTPHIPIANGLGTAYIQVSGFYESNPYTPYDKTGWEIVDYSSDNNDNAVGGRARFCIDDDVNTCWLSQYTRVNGVRPAHPHHVTVDMKENKELHGIQLFGRKTLPGKSSQTYLFPKTVHIEVSSDNNNWTSVGVFTLLPVDQINPEGTMYFEETVSGRYVRVTVLGSTSPTGDTTAIAELYPF